VTTRPAPPLSPQARRQAHQAALLEALGRRDAAGVERLLGQWVHRQGHPALQALLQELGQADPDAMAWWKGLHAATPPLATVPEPRPMPPQPKPASASPQANLELARLRSWLPDRVERRRAA